MVSSCRGFLFRGECALSGVAVLVFRVGEAPLEPVSESRHLDGRCCCVLCVERFSRVRARELRNEDESASKRFWLVFGPSRLDGYQSCVTYVTAGVMGGG